MTEDSKEIIATLIAWFLDFCGILFLIEWAFKGVMFLVNKGILF